MKKFDSHCLAVVRLSVKHYQAGTRNAIWISGPVGGRSSGTLQLNQTMNLNIGVHLTAVPLQETPGVKGEPRMSTTLSTEGWTCELGTKVSLEPQTHLCLICHCLKTSSEVAHEWR